MASRYWVGGTANWDATAGLKWSATSGGAGGASAPTLTDDVFFDGNSGTGTVTITAIANVRSINFTGFAGTFAGSSAMTLGYGAAAGGVALRLSSSMTWTATGLITNSHTAGSYVMDFAGKSIANAITISGTGGATLGSSVTTAGAFTHSGGTLNLAGYNITAASVSLGLISNGAGSTISTTGNISNVLVLGAGGTYTDVAFVVGGNLSTAKSFNMAGKTVASLTLTGAPLTLNSNVTVTGDLRLNNAAGDSVTALTGGANYTMTVGGSIVANGSPGNRLRIGNIDFSKSSGVVGLDYLYLANSDATGGATFYAGANGYDAGGNTGWLFSSAPPTVASITPDTGSTTGGESVTITGTGFVEGATVTIGGQAATSVVVVSATEITCDTPAGSEGAADVVVTNPDTQSDTLEGGFTYEQPGGGTPAPSSMRAGVAIGI